MQTIPIQALTSQSFNISLDDNQWDITIKYTEGTISVTLYLNTVLVIQNTRAVANEKIIPAKYQENGNFAIITQNNEIPDYLKFGVTQSLVYISADELAALRSNQPTIITSSDFDANGALPLRFAPQGYTLG